MDSNNIYKYLHVLVLAATFGNRIGFFRNPEIRFFSLVHGQVNWKTLLVRSKKCTTRTTRTIDFATPADMHKSLHLHFLCLLAKIWIHFVRLFSIKINSYMLIVLRPHFFKCKNKSRSQCNKVLLISTNWA